MNNNFTKKDFGEDFTWGVASAAYQIEGSIAADGKTSSIWDSFTHKKGKILNNENGDIACDFYKRYKEDTDILANLNFNAHRFSLSWTRILPEGIGKVNQKGLDFYHRLIDYNLEKGIEPWITLYHWDLPQILEDKGGWTNREIINWFSDYVDICTRTFGDKVKNWMVLNEPFAYTALGYMLGIHAPGRKGLNNFLPAVHHTALCQAEGGRFVRNNVTDAYIGTTFSCSPNHPVTQNKRDIKAALKFDALMNRLFVEPAFGLGYPTKEFSLLKRLEKYTKPNDMDRMKFDFDFIGIQNYTREIVKHSIFSPLVWAKQIPAKKRVSDTTEMGWEIYPEGIYEMLKKFSSYKQDLPIYVTENGAAFADEVVDNNVSDPKRIQFFKDYLNQVLRAKNEGINTKGYFVWSFTDNFEWAEGYKPRFGLVYVDFKTQQRIVKKSGYWFKKLLSED